MASPMLNHHSVSAVKPNPSSPNQVVQQSKGIYGISLDKATVDHSLAPKVELDSDASSSSISAPPTTTAFQSSSNSNNNNNNNNKMDELINGGSSLSSSSDVNLESNGKFTKDSSDQIQTKSEEFPAAGYDFDADPALWGLRRSGRAPKKIYIDSSAGEGSEDDVNITGSKTRAKNGRARGEQIY